MSVTPYGETEPTVSIVAPAFNEQESIEDFVSEVCQDLDASHQPYELICVDDGSTDQTSRVLNELRVRFPQPELAAFEKNSGQSAALAAGVAMARGRYIALTDSDLQKTPASHVGARQTAFSYFLDAHEERGDTLDSFQLPASRVRYVTSAPSAISAAE